MKSSWIALFASLAAVCALPVQTSRAAPEIATQLDFSSDTTPEARKFYFETIPGQRYSLWKSSDLSTWQEVAGFPKVADGLSLEHTFPQQQKEFFRVEPIDEQAPVVAEQFPGVDSYAVRRFDDLHFLFTDASGIDPASIRLSVGNVATPLAVGSAGITFQDNQLTYDSGDAALGAYGATVPVSLTVADVHGNSTTLTFSFTLEVQPKVVSNLYVFGSPTAQRAGQRIPATPTAALAKQFGPVPMAAADPWEISSVLADRVVITYTGITPPAFAANTYLTNLTPVNLSDVFYRKISSVADDPATKQLTLLTTDVPFAEIVEEGTCSLSENSVTYDLGEDGTIQPAVQIGRSKSFTPMGINLDGKALPGLSANSAFSVALEKAHAWVTPTIDIALETKGFSLQRAVVQARADFQGALVPAVAYQPSPSKISASEEVHKPIKRLVIVGSIATVPVWLDFTYSTKVNMEATASTSTTFRFGWVQDATMRAGATYAKDASPKVVWNRSASVSPLLVMPVSLSSTGTLTGKVSLVPQLDVRLQSLLGFYVNADPRAEFELTADAEFSLSGENGKIVMKPTGHAKYSGGFFADLNAGLSVMGMDQADLPAMPAFRIFSKGLEKEFPEPKTLAFTSPTASQSVRVERGSSLNLGGLATGGKEEIEYQWFHNGQLIPCQTSNQLTIWNVTAGNAGSYVLRARSGEETVFSPEFSVTTYKVVEGFSLIPAGSFTMGQDGIATPVHSVYVSAFYMGKYEVTKEIWDAVRAWGLSNGYTDLAVGNGGYASKGSNHPVHSITWYDMVKWCNARSEKEGATACYTVGGSIYRIGQNAAVVCDFAASGYRLPTEAEWEKAARGGLTGQNFPWGNTISQSQANYYATTYYSYDLSGAARNFHPSYAVGNYPYSSPVGSFAPNGYGLYDMAGNMWEWCWDWYGSYPSASQTNPAGATTGSFRVTRGGSWSSGRDRGARGARCASRGDIYPRSASSRDGFRLARGQP